ncbi:MAG TPA: hypothetical protein VGP82_08220, partial [Ktedonobacterales bacterium]|nr:hypothetical protein [Ktedonobacterales bacterium]
VFVVSLGLFLARYRPDQLFTNGIYAGALCILVIYLLTGRFWYSLFRDKAASPAAMSDPV